MRIRSKDAAVEHEARVEKLSLDKLFYLASRGISADDAEGMLVNGFIEPVAREIPLEYSVELNRLMDLEMKGSIG
jgi:Fe-S cluster assembly protein SufB